MDIIGIGKYVVDFISQSIITMIGSFFDTLENLFEPILQFILEMVHKVLPMDFIMNGHIKELNIAIFDTLNMLFVSGTISLILGIMFGTILVVCKKDGILQNKTIYFILEKIVNFFRSIPFVILIGLLAGISIMITNTRIGVMGMYIPLVFSTVPFMARQVESSLSEVDKGLIEASQAMGDTPLRIIFRVYLKESIPSIARGATITFISLLGLTAMGGIVGAGGIGNFAVRYGYQRQIAEANYVSVIIILIIVTFIQCLGNYITKKTTH